MVTQEEAELSTLTSWIAPKAVVRWQEQEESRQECEAMGTKIARRLSWKHVSWVWFGFWVAGGKCRGRRRGKDKRLKSVSMFERLCFGHERLRLSQMQLMLQFHQLMMPLLLNHQLMILSQLKYPLQLKLLLLMPLQLKSPWLILLQLNYQAQSRWLRVFLFIFPVSKWHSALDPLGEVQKLKRRGMMGWVFGGNETVTKFSVGCSYLVYRNFNVHILFNIHTHIRVYVYVYIYI